MVANSSEEYFFFALISRLFPTVGPLLATSFFALTFNRGKLRPIRLKERAHATLRPIAHFRSRP
jgi:hypothetical protein